MSRHRSARIALAAVLCLGLGAATAISVAGAAAGDGPERFERFGGTVGFGAGEMVGPFGVAADPVSGHVYVSDSGNFRMVEFTAWGEFVKAWGWGVDDGSPELQTCTAASGCQAAAAGSAAGQFRGMRGLAVDALGDIYVTEEVNRRIQKFSPDGEFLLMFGGEVNKTKSAEPGTSEAERNLCTKADLMAGDVCGVGVAGSGEGQFGQFMKSVAMGLGGTLFVGDMSRIQKFDTGGHYVGEISGGTLTGETVQALALDDGHVYAAFEDVGGKAKPGVRELDSSGTLVRTLGASNPQAITVDPEGEIYIANRHFFDGSGFIARSEVLIYDPDGNCIVCEAGTGEEAQANFAAPEDRLTEIRGVAMNVVTATGNAGFYVTYASSGDTALQFPPRAYVQAFGPPPDLWDPPVAPPRIAAQYPVAVDRDSASLRAEIDPNFWADTRYHLEYGTGKCSEGDCPTQQPVPSGPLLTSKTVSSPQPSAAIPLSGLEPGTTYRYRFVAESSGGGPVYGIDPDGEGAGEASFEAGLEGSFRTYAPQPKGPDECPNAALRTGAGTRLPDCRAYELVSPLDKEGGEIYVGGNIVNNAARLDQAAAAGSALTYSAYRSFPGSASAPYSSQYLARRGAGGWANEPISPPQRGPTSVSATKDIQYKLFLPDLSVGWIQYGSETALDPETPPGFLNLYRRENLTGGFLGLVDTVPAEERFWPELQGISADGSCAVFRANAPLTPDASDQKEAEGYYFQTYESCDGQMELVSVLPGGTANDLHSSAGTPGNREYGRTGSMAGAISADGSRVFWSATEAVGQPGKLYVRATGETAQTAALSSGVATFWAAAPSGSEALFSEGDTLYRIDVDAALAGTGSKEAVAGGFVGVVGASKDLASIYFISTEALDAGGARGSRISTSEKGERSVSSAPSPTPTPRAKAATDLAASARSTTGRG